MVLRRTCFENSRLNPLTRLSRDCGIATLSPNKGGEGRGLVVFMLGSGPWFILKTIFICDGRSLTLNGP
jgi:hypothetical protein